MNNTPNIARVNPRAPVPNIPVYRVGEKKSFFGLAKNVSRSGVYIDNHIPCLDGDMHMLELTLPQSGITIRCNTRVVWCKSTKQYLDGSYVRGMKFEDISPDTADEVDRWVRSHPAAGLDGFDLLYRTLRKS